MRVPDERGDAATEDDAAGIYMVDILVRKASLFERLFPQVHDGATLVPSEVVNPAGVSERQRRQSSLNEMTRSQRVAVAVALRELGHDVEATPVGAEVTLVYDGAPAQGKLRVGDVVVAAEGEDVTSPQELRRVMEGRKPGTSVRLRVRRDGRLRPVTVGTEPAADDPRRAVMGVLVEQAADIDLPVDVRIDAGDVGGPSAGLAFALDVVDELGREVDGGRKVAVTGEIDLEGEVYAVGGVKQKTIGARQAGVEIFVVPEGNAAEARRHADGLRIVAVDTFREALSSLTTD